jgi:TetR/AcrR family transcriptional regulator, cholesterol catabolism regulator
MTDTLDRRQLIVAASAKLFASKGVSSTTVREIADGAGILSGSLYHYFESKEGIVEEILMGFLEALSFRYAAVLDADLDPARALRAVVLTSLQLAKEQPDATTIYQNELQYLRESPRFREVQATAARAQRVWIEVIERGVQSGAFRADIDPRLFHRLIRDAVWLSVRGHRGYGDYGTEELADAICSVFLDGYATRA